MRKINIIFLVVVVSLMSGCGYRLGSLLPSDLKTVAVPTLVNKTARPSIEIEVTNGIIEEFKQDGALRVVDKSKADTILIGEIVDYRRVAQVYDGQGTVSQSKLVLSVDIVFKNLKTDEIILQSRVEGEAKFNIGASQFESEKAILPAAVKDLAQHIVERVVEGGW